MKGNMILGTASGKLGDVVGYMYNGQQASRVRRRNIANPKSDAQCVQRMIAASVSHFIGAFSEILNNAVQTESTKVATLAKIRSLNMNLVRPYANQVEEDRSGHNVYFTPKGSNYVAPAPYIMSVGTLPGLSIRGVNSDDYWLEIATNQLIATSANLKASEVFPSLQVGQQITLAWITFGSRGTMETYTHYCRFAFLDTDVPALILDEDYTSGRRYMLNPAAIDQARALGNWQDVRIHELGAFDLSVASNDESDFLAAATVIISEKNGKRRSRASMYVDVYGHEDWLGNAVWPTYGDAVVDLGIGSELYLNNDTEANQRATSGGSRAPERMQPAVTGFEIGAPSFGTATFEQISDTEWVAIRDYNAQSILPIKVLGVENGCKCYLDGVEYSGFTAANPNVALNADTQNVEHTVIFAQEGKKNVTLTVTAAEAPAKKIVGATSSNGTATHTETSITASGTGEFNVTVNFENVGAITTNDVEFNLSTQAADFVSGGTNTMTFGCEPTQGGITGTITVKGFTFDVTLTQA